jgi:hypothetical protein
MLIRMAMVEARRGGLRLGGHPGFESLTSNILQMGPREPLPPPNNTNKNESVVRKGHSFVSVISSSA